MLLVACSGGDGESANASSSGIRSVAAAGSVDGTVGQDTTQPSAPGVEATPVPTNPADTGVVIEVMPTPTVDTAPVEAAPAVPGAPIVIGLSAQGVNGPTTVRSGDQRWEVVNTGSGDRFVAIYPGTAAAPDLSQTPMASGSISPGRSETVLATLTDGSYVMVSWLAGQDGPALTAEGTITSDIVAVS